MILTDEEIRVAVEPYLTSYRSPSGDLMSSVDIIKQTKAQRVSIAKAQLKKVCDWGNETCPHDLFGEGTQCFKHACDECWKLLEEVK